MIRTLIFGAGAVGTLLGGLLSSVGHPVTFIGRRWNTEGIREKGISISGKWGEQTVGAQTAFESLRDIPSDEQPFDIVFVCVKAFDTRNAIRELKPYLSESTLVISVQNGYGNCQVIAETIGWERTLGARIITGVELTAPGTISVTVHADSVRLGHYRNEFPIQHIESLAQSMREAGIPTEATEDLEQYIWAKILYNAALNPLGAHLGVAYGALAEHESTRQIMDTILDEAFEVLHAHEIRQFWPDADAYRKDFYGTMVPATAQHFPSMLRDVQRRKPTEIDALNGAISRLGQEKGIQTPVNDTIRALLRYKEANP